MKTYKRVLCLILTCLIMFGPMMRITVLASEPVKLQVGEEKGKKGDKITIPITLSGNGVAGMDFTVIYDSQELKFIGAQKGEAAQAGNLCDINHIEERSSIRYVYASLKAIANGREILTMQFEVLDDKNKEHTVDVKVKKMLDVDIKELAYQVEGGRTIAATTGEGMNEESPDTQGGATGNDSPTADGNSEVDENASEVGKETGGAEDKKRIVIKTKDGLKDVTDSVGEKTNENLLKETGAKEKGKTHMSVYIIVGVIALGALATGVYWMWRKKKR